MKHTKKNVARKGDIAEYYAVTWLWDQGYEVFQNSGCTGPVDIIAMDQQGNTVLIDVKTLKPDYRCPSKTATCGSTRTKKQVQMGVQILSFDLKKRTLRFVKHRKYEEKIKNT